MIIRSQQMTALIGQLEERFLDRLTKLIRETYEEEATDAELRTQCAELRDRARGLGLFTEYEIASFVVCGSYFGTDFDSRADLLFRQILSEPKTEPRLKATQMLAVLDEAEESEQ